MPRLFFFTRRPLHVSARRVPARRVSEQSVASRAHELEAERARARRRTPRRGALSESDAACDAALRDAARYFARQARGE